jgi:hypothetical protein
MPVAVDTPIDATKLAPQASFVDGVKAQPDVSVVFTSVKATLAALKEAGTVAKSLGTRITLVVPQVIPYPSLPSRSLLLDHCDWRFSVVADHMPVETRVLLFPCRDRLDKLTSVLHPKSLVIIGGRLRWWWPTAEEVLARDLRRAGFEVILARQRER